MKKLLHNILSLIVLMLLGMNPAWPDQTMAPPETNVVSEPAAHAVLVVLNVSGPTLFPSNQDITDNGQDLVSLPRSTYKRLHIASGLHEFRFKPFPSGKRVAQLNAQPGQTYYLVVGYSPGKSWAFPLGGDPMTIKIVNEEVAAPLLQDMKEQ